MTGISDSCRDILCVKWGGVSGFCMRSSAVHVFCTKVGDRELEIVNSAIRCLSIWKRLRDLGRVRKGPFCLVNILRITRTCAALFTAFKEWTGVRAK